MGARTGRVFKMGQRVHVLLDRIDRVQRRMQFALLPSEEDVAHAPRPLRKGKAKKAAEPGERAPSRPKRAGKAGKTKSKARERSKKSKGKRS